MYLPWSCFSQKDLVGSIEGIGLTNNNLKENVLKIESAWFEIQFDSLGNKILEINKKAMCQDEYTYGLQGQFIKIKHVDSEYSGSNNTVNYFYTDTSELYIVSNHNDVKTDSIINFKNKLGQIVKQEQYHGIHRHTLSFAYDKMDRITKIEWYGTENQLLNKWKVKYDDANRSIFWVKTNGDSIINESHRIKLDSYGNRIYDLDENGKLIEWEYEYDKLNNWTKRAKKINGEINYIEERKITYVNNPNSK